MKYREPQTNDIIDLPDEWVHTDRERQILEYDILVYDEGTKPHWQAVADYLNEEYGYTETHISVRSVKNRIRDRVKMHLTKQAVNNALLSDEVFKVRDQSGDERRTELAKKWFGTTYQSRKSAPLTATTRRILVVSDYHGTVHPFIANALENERFDVCIHAGDILDQWAMHQSRLEGKSLTAQEKATYLDEEMVKMRSWFELLDARGGQHIVLSGNHDVRVEAAFIKAMAPLIGRESLLVRMFRTPLELLVEGLENFELVNQPLQWHYPDGSEQWAANSKFIYILGDAVVSHKNFSGKQPGTAVSKLWQWLQDYRHVLNLSDIRLCLQAHTHSLMLDKNCQGGHVNLVETGCALEATALGYGLTYQGNWTPSAVGYVTFEQNLVDNRWKTDLGSVQLHGVG